MKTKAMGLLGFLFLGILVYPSVALSQFGSCVNEPSEILGVSFTSVFDGKPEMAEVELLRWTRREAEARGDEVRVLAMPGYGHNANTAADFASAVLAIHADVVEVAAINTAGKGRADFRTEKSRAGSYGAITQQNLAEMFLQVLEEYYSESIVPIALFAHSQGAGIVMAAEQLLLAEQGFGMNVLYGIEVINMLAPAVPETAAGEDPIVWNLDQSIFDLLDDLTDMTDKQRGTYVAAVPDDIWASLFFTRTDGRLAGNVPSQEEIKCLKYSTPEPFLSAIQLVGLSEEPPRVAIDRDLFKQDSSGIELIVMCGKQDTLVQYPTCKEVSDYLGAERLATGYVWIHDAYINRPYLVAARTRVRN